MDNDGTLDIVSDSLLGHNILYVCMRMGLGKES